jgi:hypothetical protein
VFYNQALDDICKDDTKGRDSKGALAMMVVYGSAHCQVAFNLHVGNCISLNLAGQDENTVNEVVAYSSTLTPLV